MEAMSSRSPSVVTTMRGARSAAQTGVGAARMASTMAAANTIASI
jgi:hypothetical protein